MNNLIKKIAEAKKQIGAITKDVTNPFYKSKYFDINKLLEHVEPILESHGLLILQPIVNNEVFTEIWELESSSVLKSSIKLPEINDPQKLGSAITYYRRYTLQSLLSLQAEDDDANKTKSKKTLPKLPESKYKDAALSYNNGITFAEMRKKYYITEEVENEIKKIAL